MTIYLALDDSELVGCQVKSVRHVLEDIGEFDINIEHGRVSLTLVFAAMRSDFIEEDGECGRKVFKELGRAARDAKLTLNI